MKDIPIGEGRTRDTVCHQLPPKASPPAGTHGVQCISVVFGEEDPRFMGWLVPRGWDGVGPGVLRLWGFMGRKKGHKEGYKGEVVDRGSTA